jgi:hypothetical protein
MKYTFALTGKEIQLKFKYVYMYLNMYSIKGWAYHDCCQTFSGKR